LDVQDLENFVDQSDDRNEEDGDANRVQAFLLGHLPAAVLEDFGGHGTLA